MAIVSKGTFLNIKLADAAGNPANVRLNLTYADLAALSTGVTGGAIADIINDLDALTNARIVSYSYGEAFGEDADFYGAAGSEVENVALLTCKIDGEVDKSVSLRVPAPIDAMFEDTQGSGRNIVDTANALVQTWLNTFASGGEATVSDGELVADPTVSGNFKGKRIHRASRKG